MTHELHSNFLAIMKDANAEAAIRMRLKYDWIVWVYGLFCVLAQLLYQGDLGYFLLVVGSFVFVEVFEVSVYRKLQEGGEGYHMLTSQTLDMQTSFGFVLFCMFLEFVLLLATSLNFLVDAFKQSVN